MQLNVQFVGTTPLLMHNGRLANPLDPYARAQKEIASKRGKTDEDLFALMRTEARGACWETDDGRLGIPADAIFAAVRNAARAFKQGQNIERALIADPGICALTLADGSKPTCDEYIGDLSNIDYRAVRVQRARVMRARPVLRPGWLTMCQFELLEDVINPSTLVPIFERAGRLEGFGDWRPRYGRFVATFE